MLIFHFVLFRCKLEEPYKMLKKGEKEKYFSYLFYSSSRKGRSVKLACYRHHRSGRWQWMKDNTSAPVRLLSDGVVGRCPPLSLPPEDACFIVFNHNNRAMREYCFQWISVSGCWLDELAAMVWFEFPGPVTATLNKTLTRPFFSIGPLNENFNATAAM